MKFILILLLLSLISCATSNRKDYVEHSPEIFAASSLRYVYTPDGERLQYRIGNSIFDIDKDYTNTNLSSIAVGGIPVGSSFTNASLSEMFDMMLYPELFGEITGPSSSFTSSHTGLREIGAVISDITFTAGFDRGSINPQYQSDSEYRSGPAMEYQFDHINVDAAKQLTNVATSASSVSMVVESYTVVMGSQTWRGRVSYAAGGQPRGSQGTEFSSALDPGETSYTSRTITGVYAYYATTSDITEMTKQPLAGHGSTITVEMVSETSNDRQTLWVPDQYWGSLSNIQQYNDLADEWFDLAMGSFTEEVVDIDSVDYNKITHIGSVRGARKLRFVF